MTWPVGKLNEIADVISGYAFKSNWFGEGTAKVIRIGDLQNGNIDLEHAVTIDDELNKIKPQFKIQKGDILMALSGATVGKIAVADESAAGCYLNQRVAIVRSKKPESLNYLKYVFSGDYLSKLLLEAGGAAQPNLSPKDLANMEIPFPPLVEQKRIAAILDKADAIRRKRQKAIQLADDFLRAVFLEMFGDPVTNPKGWEVRPIKAGVKSITSGWSASGDNRPCEDDELGVLKISAVTSGKFIASENKAVLVSEIPEGKKLVFPKKGDMLFSRANTRELVAASCIVPEDSVNTFLPDKLWSIKTDDSLLLPEYFNHLLKIPGFKDKLTSQATGSSGSMLNISMGKFEQTECLYPPINLQAKFKELYWKLEGILLSLGESNQMFDMNFNSLSQKAFSGRL